MLINFKTNLFRRGKLLANCRKCAGFENFWNIKNSDVYPNFENSGYVNTMRSSVLTGLEPGYFMTCVRNPADEKF
jgi:hypothetical protein